MYQDEICCNDGPPEDWAPDEGSEVDRYVEDQRFIGHREPFIYHNRAEIFRRGDAPPLKRNRAYRDQDQEFWRCYGVTRRLTRRDLEDLRVQDEVTDRWGPATGFVLDEAPAGVQESHLAAGRGFTIEEVRRLHAVGRRLHRLDRGFWASLRRLGPTDSLVKRANELLLPKKLPRPRKLDSPRPPASRGQTRARLPQTGCTGARERRTTTRRTVRSSARSGDSGDSSEGGPDGPPSVGLHHQQATGLGPSDIQASPVWRRQSDAANVRSREPQ